MDETSEISSPATTGPDLIETAVSNPPASVVSSTTFTITDTVQNAGTDPAGAFRTYYYVSLNGVNIAPGTNNLGFRSISGLAAGASDTATATLQVFKGTPQGTYYVLACADQVKAVIESNEVNNCTSSSAPMVYTAPDLTQAAVSVTPVLAGLSTTYTATETVTNGAMAAAGTSTTRFLLSSDGVGYLGWIRACFIGGAIPQRVIPALAGGATSTGSTTFMCYHNKLTNTYGQIPPGTWYILACADDLNQVSEITETNNCATSNSFQVVVTTCGNSIIETSEGCDDGNIVNGDGCSSTCQPESPPDLIEAAISNPPSNIAIAGSFSVTDTATNQGTGANAAASVTKYYLSLDTVKSVEDVTLTGSRTVPILAKGASSTGTVSVSVPSIAVGSYYLLACADANSTVTETIENNNCRASTTKTTSSGADLIETAVSAPPTTAGVGGTFAITETAQNIGAGAAGASTTWFYLSLNGTSVAAPGLQLGTRSVPALAAGATSTATTTIQIKSGAAAGTYYILACADRGFVVPETNENNDCGASAGTVTITGSDLITSDVAFTPATVTAGGSINITDTTTNPTMMSTVVMTTTRFYASTDASHATLPDMMLRYCTTGLDVQHAVPVLASGSSSTVTTTAPLCFQGPPFAPSPLAPIPPGTYYILACADDGNRVAETSEANNCSASATTLTIQ